MDKCYKPSINASVYFNFELVGYTDLNGEFFYNLTNQTTSFFLHVIDRINDVGFSKMLNFTLNKEPIRITLRTNYKEPIYSKIGQFTNQNIAYIPLNYDWSQLSIEYSYEKAFTSNIKVAGVREVTVSSTLFPKKIFYIYEDLFALNETENKIYVKNSHQLNSLISNNFPKHGGIKFVVYIDLLINGGIYFETTQIKFFYVQHTLTGRLVSDIDQIDFTQHQIKIENAANPEVNFLLNMQPNGTFISPPVLPLGTYFLSIKLNHLNVTYIASGNVLLDRNYNILFKLVSLEEFINGVQCIFIQSKS